MNHCMVTTAKHALFTCLFLVHVSVAASVGKTGWKEICDLETEAMLKVLACIRDTGKGNVGHVITKFMSNNALLTRALCGAGFNIESLLGLYFAGEFMEELKRAERKCREELL